MLNILPVYEIFLIDRDVILIGLLVIRVVAVSGFGLAKLYIVQLRLC
jgi:hypothetical protein